MNQSLTSIISDKTQDIQTLAKNQLQIVSILRDFEEQLIKLEESRVHTQNILSIIVENNSKMQQTQEGIVEIIKLLLNKVTNS